MTTERSTATRAPLRGCLRLLAGVILALTIAPAIAGVRFGDAVPWIIRGADLDRIKRHLDLERFSVIAAVHLAGFDVREALIIEPLPDPAMRRLVVACAAERFCPDPLGFVASRVQILILRAGDVVPILIVDGVLRGERGRPLVHLDRAIDGRIIGWSGSAGAASGHVALALMPIVERRDGGVGAGRPVKIRWNEEAGRFQIYECLIDEDGGTLCRFREPIDN